MSKFNSHRFHGTKGSADDGLKNIRGFSTTLNEGQQGKQIREHNNYIPGKSIIIIPTTELQSLVDKFAGTGTWRGSNREVVDFHERIGTWISPDGTHSAPTTRGTIHYSKKGCHVVPAMPIERKANARNANA